MTLSKPVQESLEDASGALRNALFKAARSERPTTLTAITKLLSEIDDISRTDQLLDNLDTIINETKNDD